MKTGEKFKLLLVEDDCLIALARRMELEQYGYEIVHAVSGEEAVKMVNEDESIQMILLDIDLGRGISGTEAAVSILEDHCIPIVFMSSYNADELIKRTQRIAHYGYVTKNAGVEVVDSVIRTAFRLYEDSRKISDFK